MYTGEQVTGTRDEHYNLISVLYHALHGAENCNTYALDAEAAGEADLASFFRGAGIVQTQLAERAKVFLGIGGATPETGDIAPGAAPLQVDVPPESTPEPAPPGEDITPEGTVPPVVAPETGEEVSGGSSGAPREAPPSGEERPQRRGMTPTTPPAPREAPPAGEERPERRTP